MLYLCLPQRITDMIRISFVFSILLLSALIKLSAAVLWSQDFTSGTSGFYTTSGMTRNAGATYACALGNYVYYTSSTYAYVETNTISVPQGKGIQFSFDSRRVNSSAGTVQIYYLITGACSWDRLNPNNNGWVLWGTITPNTSSGSSTGCTSNTLNLESYICGGQNIAVLIHFPSASSSNWIAVDNLSVSDAGPQSVAVPNITGATTYTEDFTQNKWYGPVTTGNFSTTGITIPYHSYRSSSTAYTYLWSGGCNGTANHSGNALDYYAAFYTGFEFCNASGSSQVITKELNTSACAAAEVRFAYKAKYPCTAGNYDYTFDEDYDLYAPKLFTSTGQGYTWTQQAVNYYFPDGLWHFASYAVPSAANIKIRLTRGGSCTSPVEGIDNIKVFCRDCSISSLTAGTISGESNPSANTDYTYTITPTTGATYYKWMVRAIDRDPPVMIDAPCPNGTDPCIVSGQGTTSCTINFGSLTGSENFRVVCIPYDGNPGTAASPSDACYAKLSLFPATVLPLEWGSFSITDQGSKLLLRWSTLSETNTSHFTVERAREDENFVSLGTIPAAGYSNESRNYEYTDNLPGNGIFYYRIRQSDFNGAFSFSRVLSVISENPNMGISMKMTTEGTLNIESDYNISSSLTLSLFNNIGQKCLEFNIPALQEGINEILLPETGNGLFLFELRGNGIYATGKGLRY